MAGGNGAVAADHQAMPWLHLVAAGEDGDKLVGGGGSLFVEDELNRAGGGIPADVDNGFIASIAFFGRVGRDRQGDVLEDAGDLRGGDAHEKNEQNQQHIDHRRDLEFGLAVAATTTTCHKSKELRVERAEGSGGGLALDGRAGSKAGGVEAGAGELVVRHAPEEPEGAFL